MGLPVQIDRKFHEIKLENRTPKLYSFSKNSHAEQEI